MKTLRQYTPILATLTLSLLLHSCTASAPKESEAIDSLPPIYPAEYIDAYIPRNIAPMNFMVKTENEVVVHLSSGNGAEVDVEAEKDGVVRIDRKEWERLKEKTEKINVCVYEKKEKRWHRYKEFAYTLSADSIDKYITYRLIEPSYQASGRLGLYSYDLERGEEKPIATVSKQYSDPLDRMQMCVNCHHTQREGKFSIFYYRGKKGGLIVTKDGKARKINTKGGDMKGGTSYASIHPTLPYIAFTTALTRQLFHTNGHTKLDVFDWFSDLMLYDVENNQITNIVRTKDKNESFPAWSADGKSLYYVSTDSVFDLNNHRKMKYELMQIDFNAEPMKANHTWTNPRKVLSYADKDSSITMPKCSPDGRFLAFTKAQYGVSTQTNQTADWMLIDLNSNRVIETEIVNSKEADSYHSWSSNSRWVVMSSRRENGNYMRLYLFHVSEDGRLSRPFIVPRENPMYNHHLLKCYNVPDFAKTLPALTPADYDEMMLECDAEPVRFASPIDSTNVDGESGASMVR